LPKGKNGSLSRVGKPRRAQSACREQEVKIVLLHSRLQPQWACCARLRSRSWRSAVISDYHNYRPCSPACRSHRSTVQLTAYQRLLRTIYNEHGAAIEPATPEPGVYSEKPKWLNILWISIIFGTMSEMCTMKHQISDSRMTVVIGRDQVPPD
jgi:hypothetical protein